MYLPKNQDKPDKGYRLTYNRITKKLIQTVRAYHSNLWNGHEHTRTIRLIYQWQTPWKCVHGLKWPKY